MGGVYFRPFFVFRSHLNLKTSIKMLIYKDLFAGDCDILSDIYKIESVFENTMYKVKGKNITKKVVDESTFGGNASAEGGDDESASGEICSSGVDIALNSNLQSGDFMAPDRKSLKTHQSGYCKQIIANMKKNGKSEEEIKAFKTGAAAAIGYFNTKETFENLTFYMGESDNYVEKGQIIPCFWEEAEGEVSMYYWIDGLKSEKC